MKKGIVAWDRSELS